MSSGTVVLTKSSSTTQKQPLPGSYHKRLEGVQATTDLRQLIRDARSLGTSHADTKAAATTIANLNNNIMSHAVSFPSPEEAVEILRNFDTTLEIVPMSVLRAVETLSSKKKEYLQRLDQCLRTTKLAFTPPPPAPSSESETEERRKFRRRIERLKLQQEESRYSGLTQNVGRKGQADDVTARSMTYAASIGLNMIIAPLSFGCFMYFFAGGLFNYMGWDDNRPAHMGPDIRKVIAGVVSGVVMLMIEMILFVIRSHEIDKATSKRARTMKTGAFGYYTANTERHFKGE